MALELGLGITPWSPLKSGALSGKYTRKNAGEAKGDRGCMDSFLNEKAFTVVDALDAIAHAHGSSVARVALSWVQAQPGVSSTIIGARRLTQLEDNVGSIDVRLTPEELGGLDALTKPTFGFPQNMQPIPRDSQRRHERERRLRGSLRFRDGEGQHALLSCPRSRLIFGARRGLSSWETRR
jgi:diketogulonate reductase-like aldo/keto reductase